MKYFKLIIVLIFIQYLSFSQGEDKNSVYNSLVNKFKELETIEIKFKMPKVNSTFDIKAKKGDKYIIDYPERKIICDGTTIWNYSKDDNNVTISKFDPKHADLSIEKFFFKMIANSEPLSLYKSSSSTGKISKYLVLQLKDNKEKFNEIKIGLGPKNEIEEINISGKGINLSWDIVSIGINPKLDTKLFGYTIPKGVEVIDLR